MLHRTTWVAAPIIALVVVGAGLGWWGYDQNRQRQALTVQFENQYSSSFHGLVSNTRNLESEIGKALISGDVSAFHMHLSNIWRLSYAAQTDFGRIPANLMPLHSVQVFLSSVSKNCGTWMENDVSPTDKTVHRQLESYYSQSKQISSKLENLQTDIFVKGLTWQSAEKVVMSKGSRDSQIVDGLRAIDSQSASFIESAASPTSPLKGHTSVLQNQKTVTGEQAKSIIAKFLNLKDIANWTVKQSGKGAYVPVYILTGSSPAGLLDASVSKQGGHVLSFRISHSASSSKFDFVQAQQNSETWLKNRGFGTVIPFSAQQYAHTGYFVFAPTISGVPVLSQGISMEVALDNGQITAYDANQYYFHPVTNLPPRKYSTQSLQAKLNGNFQVRMAQQVIVLDKQGRYQPAVSFYGTSGNETYRIFMNANTGKEMDIEQLTHHDTAKRA